MMVDPKPNNNEPPNAAPGPGPLSVKPFMNVRSMNTKVNGHCPQSVKFYELDDERYLDQWREKQNGDDGLFDVITFNFAVNESKAIQFATELLNKNHGRLLAPINTSKDYWLKQDYIIMDSKSNVLWSAVDVGAWSVQFQPDVTQDTCSGVWCAPFNGFQKKR